MLSQLCSRRLMTGAVLLGSSSILFSACPPFPDHDDDDMSCPCWETSSPIEDTSTPHPEDHDGDGYAEEDGDCDDTDPSTYPGAEEDPDGIDNDCDGWIDEDFGDDDTSSSEEDSPHAGDDDMTLEGEDGGEVGASPSDEENDSPIPDESGQETPTWNTDETEAPGDTEDPSPLDAEDAEGRPDTATPAQASPATSPGTEDGMPTTGTDGDEPGASPTVVDNERTGRLDYDAGSCDCDLSGKTPASTSLISMVFGIMSLGYINRRSRKNSRPG